MCSLFILISSLIVRSTCLLCQQCGGELYSGGLRLLRSMCCTATAIECPVGFVCIRALVVSSKKNFILSGCYFPEDGLIGCDSHTLPHNGTIQRCVCVNQSCQSYFPNGTCTQGLDTLTSFNSYNRKPTTRTTHTLISSATANRIGEFHYAGLPNKLPASSVWRRHFLLHIALIFSIVVFS
ncbi:unnamed protein product [Angiostrongylus costaricensis]|uniref:EB domain-containing protein n=1 Tax=Angiostrongylus costaricensis TaxID=334426 RepID=A0A0R3PMU1_ANGCS|nr:unnamed protein product [Angiostrongylus costaricensis]